MEENEYYFDDYFEENEYYFTDNEGRIHTKWYILGDDCFDVFSLEYLFFEMTYNNENVKKIWIKYNE